MRGNDVLVITERDRKLFDALGMLRVVDRQQARTITGRVDVSVSTTNTRLKKLVDAGLLNRFFIGTAAGGVKALYALNSKSAALVSDSARPLNRRRDSVLISDPFVQHQLAVNDVLIPVKFLPVPSPDVHLVRMAVFSQVLSRATPLIPDGYLELANPAGIHPMFCEVDLGTEPQRTWATKARLYLQLATTGEYEQLFRQSRFRVLVIADSERRLLHIRRTVATQTSKIFFFSTLTTIRRAGLLASHWLRPEGEGRQALL